MGDITETHRLDDKEVIHKVDFDNPAEGYLYFKGGHYRLTMLKDDDNNDDPHNRSMIIEKFIREKRSS